MSHPESSGWLVLFYTGQLTATRQVFEVRVFGVIKVYQYLASPKQQ